MALSLAMHEYLNNQYWIVQREILQMRENLGKKMKINALMGTYVLYKQLAEVLNINIVQIKCLLGI